MEEVACVIEQLLVLLESVVVGVALLLIDSACGALILAAHFDVSVEGGNLQLLAPHQLWQLELHEKTVVAVVQWLMPLA
jgi:hypothetical protein